MSRTWLAVLAAISIVFLAGCSSGNSTSSSPAGQTQQGSSAGSKASASGGPAAAPSGNSQSGAGQGQAKNISPQNLRSGKVVSFTGSTVTVAVERGGADVGTSATYKLTSSTSVMKDHSPVSTSGRVPDLGSLGLKSGYYVNLMVTSGSVTSLQFNSDGSQDQGPPPGPGGGQNQGPPPAGSPTGQQVLYRE